jgi:hypothetical protein
MCIFSFYILKHHLSLFSGTGSHVQCAVQILMVIYFRSSQIIQKSGCKLKNFGRRKRVTRTKFHTEESQISGAAVRDLVARATWRPGFVYPWSTYLCFYAHRIHACVLLWLPQHSEIVVLTVVGFCTGAGVCSLRGTNRIFKYSWR